MLAFKRVNDAWEYRLLHPRLHDIVSWLVEGGVWRQETGEEDAVVTEVFRSRAQTLRLYEEAGMPPPAYSVHEALKDALDPLSGCRGIDFSVRSASAGCRDAKPYTSWPLIAAARLHHLVERMNATWRYQESEAHQVAVLHAVAGLHLHFQVRPGDETRRRGE